MSISKLSKIGPGCIYVISGLMLLGVVGGFLMQGSRGPQQGREEEQAVKDVSPPVAQIGDYVITAGMVTKPVDEQIKQIGTDPSPATLIKTFAGSLDQQVSFAIAYRLIKDNAIDVTDADIIKASDQEFASQMAQIKQALIARKTISENATDAQVRDAAKKLNIDLDQQRATSKAQLQSDIKDPAIRPHLVVAAGFQKLKDKIASTIKVSDEELKKPFDQFVLKRIFVENAGSQAAVVKANEALKAVKGGMSFEEAMSKYSQDRPAKGVALKDTTTTVLRSQLPAEAKDALEKLKAGEITPVLDSGVGSEIYKVISIKPNLPKDFEKTKAASTTAYQQAHAPDKLQEQIKKLEDSNVLQWQEPSFQALYQWNKITSDRTRLASPKKDRADFDAMLALIKKSTNTDESVLRITALTELAIFDTIYGMAMPDERKKMADQRIEVLAKSLQFSDDTAGRLELAQLYFEKKDKKSAAENLITAANRILSEMQDPNGQSQGMEFQVNKLTNDMGKAGMLTPEDQKQLDEVHKQYDDAFRMQQEEQKKMEEDRKKQEEEDRKKADAVPGLKPGTPSPKGPGVTPPTPKPSASPSATPKAPVAPGK